MNRLGWTLCFLSASIIICIGWQGWQAKRVLHKEYERVIMQYIDDCPGTRIQEVKIVKGEKIFSIRCEESEEELPTYTQI
jgi:hypothetical protein